MEVKYTQVNLLLGFFLIPLMLVLPACQSDHFAQSPPQTSAIGSPLDSAGMPTRVTAATALQAHNRNLAATLAPKAKTMHHLAPSANPVLAFYYMWYNTSSWDSAHMSDLPPIKYKSFDDESIDQQISWAANAGITGFVSSWWGQGDQTDTGFAKLLAHAATLENTTSYHFTSTLYFECDSPNIVGTAGIIQSLRYLIDQYSYDPHFFSWYGKPVILFWNPLGNGRTISQWASIRSQVDPNNRMIWSAEGVDTTLLDVFDGIHLFSAGYWGLLHNRMPAVDQEFRAKVNAYNSTHGTHKIWAAGVMPGYDDTRIAGRQGTFIVPRNNGATYHTSWKAAISSNPEWITITSFNEWFEGSMIEPSVTYGTSYLDITRQYTQQW
jgi:hypothetical protein